MVPRMNAPTVDLTKVQFSPKGLAWLLAAIVVGLVLYNIAASMIAPRINRLINGATPRVTSGGNESALVSGL